MKTEVFYDKMLDRMDKMIVAMNKLTRALEAMEKWRNGMCISLTDGDVPKKEDMMPKSLEAIEKAEKQAAERMNKYSDQLNEMA